ncbi:hypothetical protein SAMN06265379_101800 [Saccharicrinis carchari]|uniref:Uncharacterized protein n=1 Tax=Saccharicrinis carchari TaxID=1168039 RepID=A0A521B9D6_SACCC|nr:cytochrome c3 family protein [Saccharicrinis carchari]SMO43641.1 hypothetical protein SAMN06265379_101800 [Saccharicrinis carchari]
MKYTTFFKFILSGFICALLATSCTKEGPVGAAGADGTNGVDGNQSCLTCHSQASVDALATQYAASSHANPGFELGYAGIRQGCMECHSHEGFTSYTMGYYPSSNLDFASKISCGTCHGDHQSLEEGISAPMRTTASVLSKADGTTVFDFEGSSNTCANCHQSRSNGNLYADVDSVWNNDGSFAFSVHADSVYLSSTHASPHYTTMTNNIFGVGGYTNETGKVMDAHKKAGCVGCHMGEAESGKLNGGHTMLASVTSCTACHTDATNFDIGGVQTKTNQAEEAIAQALVEKGILDESHNAVVGVYHKDVFEAYWNYKIIHYDGSAGVHNPDYTELLLNHAKEKLGL